MLRTHVAARYVAQFSSDLQPKNTEKWLSDDTHVGRFDSNLRRIRRTTIGDFSGGITNENNKNDRHDGGNDDEDDDDERLSLVPDVGHRVRYLRR